MIGPGIINVVSATTLCYILRRVGRNRRGSKTMKKFTSALLCFCLCEHGKGRSVYAGIIDHYAVPGHGARDR